MKNIKDFPKITTEREQELWVRFSSFTQDGETTTDPKGLEAFAREVAQLVVVRKDGWIEGLIVTEDQTNSVGKEFERFLQICVHSKGECCMCDNDGNDQFHHIQQMSI